MGFQHQFSSEKRCSSQVCKNDGLRANSLVAIGEKVGWFWCVSGWELTKTTGSRASAHVVAFCFLIRKWHKQMSLSTQRLCRNFLKATAPGVLHHWELRTAGSPPPCRAGPPWWFRLFPWPRPGPGSWMSRWISSTNPKKMDTNHEMLQKSQTHDMMNSAVARGGGPLRWPSLHALVAYLVVCQVDSFYGLVDKERVREGLQCWTTYIVNWSACQDCHSCPLMSNPHVAIQPTLFYMFA